MIHTLDSRREVFIKEQIPSQMARSGSEPRPFRVAQGLVASSATMDSTVNVVGAVMFYHKVTLVSRSLLF